MFADVTQHIEAGHCFHLDVGDDYLGRDRVELFYRFGRGVERKHLVPFVTTERYTDLYHCGLVVYNYDFSHGRTAENISEMRKGKQKRETVSCGVSLTPQRCHRSLS